MMRLLDNEDFGVRMGRAVCSALWMAVGVIAALVCVGAYQVLKLIGSLIA